MPGFYGHPTGVLENSTLRVEYLLNAGPRLVRLFLAGNPRNLLGEFPDLFWDTPNGRYQLFGGHRLWAAPEEHGISYLPDSEGLEVQATESQVQLKWTPVSGQGLGKTIQIQLDPDQARLHLHQCITNHFDRTLNIAPWGITAFPLGGRAFVPCAAQGKGLQPDRVFAVWPYSRLDDTRIHLHEAGIEVNARSQTPPLKLGAFAKAGYCAYFNDNVLIVKNFQVSNSSYPDRGCNTEIYCSEQLIELETLSSASELGPGESANLDESWTLYSGHVAELKWEEMFRGNL